MSDWFEYKVRKKLRRRMARVRAALIRVGLKARRSLGLAQPPEFVTSRHGVRMRANWDDRTFQYCYFGVYGPVLADFLTGQGSDFVFLDVGANQGLYSLVAARNPHCRHVVALEPVAATFELLRQNVAENGIAERATLLQAALAEREGTAQITVPAGHSGVATLARGASHDKSGAQTQAVDLIDAAALDQYLRGSLPIIAKVDVEGYEHVVLAELMRLAAAGRIVAVFYEVDTRWSDAEGLRSLLVAGGFDAFVRYGRTRHYDVLATRAVAH
jgi:FkbM family methyltransferase